MMPTISIITPVYNGARFIAACIQVVIDQHCTDAEHIIVDGGSTDGTVDIIKRYAAQYTHIRWVSEKDRGQSDAMNKGIAMARGEIIGFLNVDDYYEPNVLNRVLELFKTATNPTLVVGNCNVWGDSGDLLYVNAPRKMKLEDLLLGPDANVFPMNAVAYFYHKALHEKIGLYDADEHYSLDLDFLLRAVQSATVKYVDETFGNYRMLQGTKSVVDAKSGEAIRRRERLFEKYRAQFPLLQRWRLAIGYKFYHECMAPIRYFSRHPKELSWRLETRLKHSLARKR